VMYQSLLFGEQSFQVYKTEPGKKRVGLHLSIWLANLVFSVWVHMLKIGKQFKRIFCNEKFAKGWLGDMGVAL